MSRKFASLAVFLLSLLWAGTVFAGSVDVYAFKMISGQTSSQPAAYFQIRMCRTGTQTCTYGVNTDPYGHGNVYISPEFAGYYDLYLYKDYGANYGGTSGLDAQRTAPNWPVTYEIWTSSTPVGWPQGQEWMAVSDAPCNPDAYGRCVWYVDYLATEPGAQYTWRIVAKMNIGGGLFYKTSSPTWHLHQNY